jgi:predicted N-acetyltransferase YhbS
MMRRRSGATEGVVPVVTIRNEHVTDIGAREALLDRAFGTLRLQKSAERLREGRLPAEGLSFTAEDDGRVVGTVRLWNINAGPERPALLLGPLAVDGAWRGLGIGAGLMRRATEAALQLGRRAIVLVGDPAYYRRFGFSAEKTGRLWMPGPYERPRLLAKELVLGALDHAYGLIVATGRVEPKPNLAVLVADLARSERELPRRAAIAARAA